MLRLAARAKINWTLDIVGARQDGYHLMDMLMTSVALADTLTLETAQGLSLAVTGGGPQAGNFAISEEQAPAFASFPVQGGETNLVFRAARALQRATGCRRGAAMALHKQIPVGAGMGGGSADAAAALLGLCRLWEITLPMEKLMEIALSLGADVPFLLTGGLARVRGIGENIQSLPFPAPCQLVLVQPCAGLSTPEIFRAFDALPETEKVRPQTERAQQALLAGDLPILAQAMGNVMEPVSLQKRPEMEEALWALKSCGALRALMTGSGSVVYGVFAQEKEAQGAFEALRTRWERTYLTHTVPESVVFLEG